MAYLEYDGAAVRKQVAKMRKYFDGDIYYAVKANPNKLILKELTSLDIRGFDVASIEEIKAVRSVSSDSDLIFTHPVKSRSTIAQALNEWDIRSFVVDTPAEWDKLSDLVEDPSALEIFIRVKAENHFSAKLIDFNEKFGLPSEFAASLSKKIAKTGAKVSWSFHPGSQQLDTGAYERTLRALATIIQDEALNLHRISIGGGFAVNYGDRTTPEIEDLLPDLHKLKQDFPRLKNVDFIAEPGRFLSANCMNLIADIIAVDMDRIFIDDGIYGTLLDCALVGARFPVAAIGDRHKGPFAHYSIFGPTCDALDRLPGTYPLPTDLHEGDQLKIMMVGAYGSALTDNFNGLCRTPLVQITSESADASRYTEGQIAING